MRSESSLKEVFARAGELVGRQEGGRRAAALLADQVDEVVRALLADACAAIGGPGDGVALLAVGGYGRRELSPWSDIDILLLHRGWAPDDLKELNRLVMYPLWDSGHEIGNRVRDTAEVLRSLSRTDEATAILDARLVGGDHRLALDLSGAVADRLHKSRGTFIRGLAEANADRHAAAGHLGHLLEPDIKEGAGGLRDIHALSWMSRVQPGTAGVAGLVEKGILSSDDGAEIELAWDWLLGIRAQLHLVAGRRRDRLYLDDQDAVAERLGYADNGRLPPGDALMRSIYSRARNVDSIATSAWERILRPTRPASSRWSAWRAKPQSSPDTADGWALRDGRLEAVAVASPRDDPGGWIRAFLAAARRGSPIGRATANRVERALRDGGPIVWTPDALDAFVEVLSDGEACRRALAAMDGCGLLECLIPEWGPVRCLPQRNPYHRYTVDVHAFAAVEEIAASRTSGSPEIDDAWSRVGDPAALLLATLFHDIGKGRSGDHSQLGADLSRAAVERMGLSGAAVQDVVHLVREHLTLPDLATHRDLSDERTIVQAATRAGDARRLAMLLLLTRADSIATGPQAWSAFRSSLVRELYARTLRLLESGETGARDARERRAELLAERHSGLTQPPPAPGEVRTRVTAGDDVDELVVVAADRPGLIATVTGVLAARGINVVGAEVYTRPDGVALEAFRVTHPAGALDDARWESIRGDLERAVQGRLDVDAAIAEKATAPTSTARRRTGEPSRVNVDNGASDSCTVVEVHTRDRVGLLRTITSALARAGCDVRLAFAGTYGDRAVDVFYVVDLNGRRISEEAAIAALERAVLDALKE